MIVLLNPGRPHYPWGGAEPNRRDANAVKAYVLGVCEGRGGDTPRPKTLRDLVGPQEQVKSRKSTKKLPIGVTVTFWGLSSGE